MVHPLMVQEGIDFEASHPGWEWYSNLAAEPAKPDDPMATRVLNLRYKETLDPVSYQFLKPSPSSLVNWDKELAEKDIILGPPQKYFTGHDLGAYRKIKEKAVITITYSPCQDDETPFSYEEDGLIGWVDEVFLEGYKHPNTPLPTLQESLDILEGAGYQFNVKR